LIPFVVSLSNHERNQPIQGPLEVNMNFELDARLVRDCHRLGRFALCELLLMNDAQYPWCILVPQRAGLREIYELAEAEQAELLRESVVLGRTLMTVFGGDKLNVAALGNVVAQLHVHHVVRRIGDAAWPAPVWGRVPARPYAPAELEASLQALLPRLPAAFEARYSPPPAERAV
jgi:diadenosine tetraphosphate (Ap4A) HIT family hydrolase